MYCTFFGFRFPPFRITPYADIFFEGARRGAIVEALLYGVAQADGILKVTGETGTGKTMLCRVLQARLPAGMQSVYLANPDMSPRQAMHAIVQALGLTADPTQDPTAVLHAHLRRCLAQETQVVILVEEAQRMPVRTLDAIRLLANLEAGPRKVLQIVLIGQPELDDLLRQHEIRQLRDRIVHSIVLEPLSPDEVSEYIAFRVRSAGHPAAQLFSTPAARHIARASGGLARRVNVLADKTLLAAFAENTHDIALRHARMATKDSGYEPNAWSGRMRQWLRNRNTTSAPAAAGPR